MAPSQPADPVSSAREQLRARAHVFEDPDSYVAGVEDALEIVQVLAEEDES
jgi:hypothetical protein